MRILRLPTLGKALVVALALLATACGSSSEDTASEVDTDTAAPTTSAAAATQDAAETTAATAEEGADPDADEATSDAATTADFVAEVWADNWFALHVNGELVGEDSVPITTERSFNAEVISFTATYPLTIAIEAKDFKETDSGIEYIGEGNQQMGDGGLIAQITDTTTGEVIAVTNGDWTALAVHRAPLNKDCEKDEDPDATCEVEILDTPAQWTTPAFDDAAWAAASVWDEAAVGPKDGYDEIDWASDAQLIWGTDLETDNTVLFRLTAPAG